MKIFIRLFFEVLVLISILLYFYFDNDIKEYIGKHSGVASIMKYIFFLMLIDSSTLLIQYFYHQKTNSETKRKDNFHYGINNIAKMLIAIGFIITLFSLFGIEFKALITSLSIVAAAIAIISKDYVNDFLVGIYFSFSKNFEINDYVKMGEHKGKILEIEMLKLKLLNDDDDLVIIPNGKVYMSEIINYTKRDIRLMSIDFQMDIKSIENIETLEEEMQASLTSFEEFIEKDSYNLKIVEVKKDYIEFKFQYTLKLVDRELQKNIRRKSVREIFNHVSSKNQKRMNQIQPIENNPAEK